MRRRLSIVIAVAVILGLSVGGAHAAADPAVTCRAAIGKGAAAFAQAKTKVLQKCAENRFKGKLVATQAGPLADCHADQKTQGAIDKAQTKTTVAIEKACGGKDTHCDTVGDEPLASIGWDNATCQDFEGRGCTNAIANCDDIGTCVTCIGEKSVDQAIDLYYHSLTPADPNPLDPKLEKARNKCRLAIGKSAAALLLAESKAIQKCWDTVNKGKATGPCPPIGADQKTDDAILKAKGKYDAATCKACGAGKPCDITQSPFTRADIGFAPLCPPVVRPGIGGHTCDFGRTLVSLEDVVDCAECVTEFKVDCATVAASRGFPQAPSPYPPECAAALPVTPTPTATPVLTATSTAATATPTPTATVPGPSATQTPTNGSLCPSRITFTGTSTNGVLDSGWTGQGHDATVVSDGTITVAVTSCADPAPNCGVCNISGPVDNDLADAGQIHNHRCTGDTRIKCSTTADCSGTHCLAGSNDGATCTTASECPGGSCSSAGTCEYYFGTYLPLAAGGVATCVGNQVNGSITGTANVTTGSAASSVQLISRVSTGPNPNPCPKCLGDGPKNDGIRGGTCDVGPNHGLTCDINGTSPNAFWGSTSLDCPPDSAAVIAALPINLTNSTGTQTLTVSAANPPCRAPGFGAFRCLCDTCDNLAATSCGTNADCTAVGATVCGGRRCVSGTSAGVPCSLTCALGSNAGAVCTVPSQCPGGSCTGNSQCLPGGACTVPGQATLFNQCSDAVCVPTNTCVGGTNQDADCGTASQCPGGSCAPGNEGECAGGPFEQFCGPHGTFQSCGVNGDCASLNACAGGANVGAACNVASQCPGSTCQSKVGGTADQCVIGKFRECFLDNGTIGNTVNATGLVDPPANHQSDPILSSLFCIGPTTSGSVNAAAGLPGLGRLELQGHATDNGTP